MKCAIHIRILYFAEDNPRYKWVEIFASPVLAITHPILFIAEWIKYSRKFFFIAPINKWHDYFGSHWRVVIACVYGVLELREARKQGVWEFQQRRNELIETVKKGNGIL